MTEQEIIDRVVATLSVPGITLRCQDTEWVRSHDGVFMFEWRNTLGRRSTSCRRRCVLIRTSSPGERRTGRLLQFYLGANPCLSVVGVNPGELDHIVGMGEILWDSAAQTPPSDPEEDPAPAFTTWLSDAIREADPAAKVQTFREAEIMTEECGLVVTSGGVEYQVTIVETAP